MTTTLSPPPPPWSGRRAEKSRRLDQVRVLAHGVVPPLHTIILSVSCAEPVDLFEQGIARKLDTSLALRIARCL